MPRTGRNQKPADSPPQGDLSPEMAVKFLASLEGVSCIKFDGDGAGQVKLSVPASEIGAVARLLTMRERVIEVSVRPRN